MSVRNDIDGLHDLEKKNTILVLLLLTNEKEIQQLCVLPEGARSGDVTAKRG